LPTEAGLDFAGRNAEDNLKISDVGQFSPYWGEKYPLREPGYVKNILNTGLPKVTGKIIFFST
jgi:hypothetical protein